MTIPEAFDFAIKNHLAGRLADAEALCRQILAAQPNHPDAPHMLGIIAHQAGRHDHAVEWLRQAVVLAPNNPAAQSNLGEAYRAIGRLDEAVAAYRRALQIKWDFPEAHSNLGNALRDRGQIDEAIACYHRALELKPGYPEAHHNLGNALRDQGKLDESVAAFHRALELQPGYAEAHNNLGIALGEKGQPEEAEAAFRRALELKPGLPEAQNNLGNALKDQGELDEAIAIFRRALKMKPEDARTHSNLIYTLHFHPDHNLRTISEECDRWNRQFSEPLQRFIMPRTSDRGSDRPLRIGYVSPDFREHVVGRNLAPLFQRHDRRDFEILCYAEVMRPDKMTDEFRGHANQWRSTVGVSDEAFAEMIRKDGVDILVDLAQHLAGNRLPVFARKPAPVQVSFAGYPESAGLEAIEYRISDRYLESGSAEDGAGWKDRVCMIDSFWCYDPCGVEVEIHPLPALESGTVTFGCLNNFCKINERVIRLWARALGKVAGSRLVMSSLAGSHRLRTLEAFERQGIDGSRLEFVGYHPRREYLELYHRLDIVLDTFPYNGHTTSLDALWMGVPVVSLAGEMPVSRAGLSQLSNLGLPELVAHTEEDYVRVAVDLAEDLPRVARLRSTLRDRMKNSVLMDAPRFTRQIERAYREMWQAWRAAGA